MAKKKDSVDHGDGGARNGDGGGGGGEPDFNDPPDFVDNIADEGRTIILIFLLLE